MTTRQIIRSYYRISGLYTLAASIIWGVNTLFLLDAGLSVFEVFVANAAFSAGMVVFEIPTGIVADTKGRRFSFLLSLVVLFATTLAYLAAWSVQANVVVFVAVSVLLGLGFTFYSGAVDAWVVDALTAAGHRGGLDSVFAGAQQISGTAMLVGTVGGGVLGGISLSVPYLVRAGLLAVLFGIAVRTMQEYGFQPREVTLPELPAAMRAEGRAGIAFGWSRPSLRLLMIGGLVQTGFLYWGFYAWQPYLLELLERDAVWVAGVVSALVSLATIAGNSVVRRATRYCGRRTTLLAWGAGVMTVAAVGVGLATTFWLALTMLLLMMAGQGLMTPVRAAYVHAVVPTEHRATVLSFDSMVANVGGVGGQVGLGALAEGTSIATGYVVGGLATITVLPVVYGVRRIGESADLIVGIDAGIASACAAQGTPEVAAVSTAAAPDTA